MKYEYEIYNKLNKFKNKDRNRMHMPGHKAQGEFKSFFPVAPLDITELSYSDDLHCPKDEIERAQSDLAEIVGAKKAYITTDGSSSGVLAMLYVAAKFGNKIIVPRNSHKSVYNACRIFNLEPVIVQGPEYEGVLLPPEGELIERLVVNDVNISGMIVASPDYYGNIAPLDEYAAILKKHGRHLFADGAHGAHFALEEDRADYCGVYADMWVDGAHKSLPTLTQGALVCVNDDHLVPYVEEALAMFRTSSPSFPVMASVEYGYKYFINNPKFADRAKNTVAEIKEQLSAFTFYPSRDWTKLAVDFKPLDIDPTIAMEYLERKGIYAEMNDGRYILFYISKMTEPSQIYDLKNTLLWIAAQKKNQGTFKDRKPYPSADRTYSFLYALKQRSAWVPLEESVGKMCAENAGVTPPCFPVVVAGEIISQQAVALLKSGKSTFGIVDGKIKTVKK